MNSTLKRLAEPGVRMYVFFLLAFAGATALFGLYKLAIAEAAVVVILLVYTLIMKNRREKQLAAYIESVTYNTENAKNNTLTNFPLPIAVFRLDDSRIIWGNEMFFTLCGKGGNRLDARISDMVPQFNGKWLMEGKTQYPGLIELNGKRYELRGNIVRSEKSDENSAFMGITYWLDVTDYEETRSRFLSTRPIVCIAVIDNLEELLKNQTERVKNNIRDGIEDKLNHWAGEFNAVVQRYERDRYLILMESEYYEKAREGRFSILEAVHEVVSPSGINASFSLGIGAEAESFEEAWQFAGKAAELALSRGGDQAVVKNRLNFEFFGGRAVEVETRTKVRSRVLAKSFSDLVKESSMVFVMGHKYGDLDSIGAAVGVCSMARKLEVSAHIVVDEGHCLALPLIRRLREDEFYKDIFIDPQEAMLRANGRTLLVVVDTSRPERVEDVSLIETCNRVAVIDHHRVGATYIENAALGIIEPTASSACEIITEILGEITEMKDIRPCEADALLSGIVLDTKNFTLRAGERTFEAAAALKRAGADPVTVKRLLQSDMSDTVAKYSILQSAALYKNIAIAVPREPQQRVVAAQAADEMLNIVGVDASVVIAPDGNGGAFASARSIGELNVQLIMEKVGGGGSRNAAAAQFPDTDVETAREKVCAAIDDYLEVK